LQLELEMDNSARIAFVERCLEATGLTQRQFARVVGIGPSTLWRWLDGRRQVPLIGIKAVALATMMAGVPVHLPSISKYLAATGNPAKGARKPTPLR
jgi:transcriptional regulator with XRE-family HTH domain